MKRFNIIFLLVVLISMTSNKAQAYDFTVQNISYNYINDSTELEVARCAFAPSGAIDIPEEVTYLERTLKVTAIGEYAFQNCFYLGVVTIPNSVTTIGAHSFEYNDLTSITIPNSVTTIGEYAFQKCKLESVIISNSVTTIEKNTFAECYALKSITIPNSVTTIEKEAFYECYALASIAIPNSVTTIGEGAFQECSSLKSIAIPNSVTTIGERAFYGCRRLGSIAISNSVTTIEKGTFQKCSSLWLIAIPNSVTTIGKGAFEYCSGLTSIAIPNSVTTIEESTFAYCSSLKNVTFPKSIKSISNYAFYNCKNISRIEYLAEDIGLKGPLFDISSLHVDTIIVSEQAYPHLIENIEWTKYDKVFARGIDNRLYIGIRNDNNNIIEVNGVSNKSFVFVSPNEDSIFLQRMSTSPAEMSVMINGESAILTADNPKMSVKLISRRPIINNIVYATDRNTSGQNNYSVNISTSGTLLSLIGKNNLEKVKYLKISGDINGTDILAIQKMTNLQDLDMSKANITNGGSSYLDRYTTSINHIGAYFFQGMSNLTIVHLPESATTIEEYAFHGCTKLQEVIIPASFTEILSNAFATSGIKKIIFEECKKPIHISSLAFDDNTMIFSVEAYRDFDYSRNSHYQKPDFGNDLRRLVIDGEATTFNILAGYESLMSLVIGPKIKAITQFRTATSLKSVIFKDSDSNIELNKNGITGEDYYYEMFKNSPLKELYLGRPIDKFSYGTFMNLPSLTDLTISEKVTSIATNLFKDDTGLKKVILPNSVTHIYDNAFNGCVSLSEISIPSQLTWIGEGAFKNCIALANIEIPTSIPSQLTWIGEGAFENCIALANIEIPTSIYGIGLRAFFNCSSLTSISIGNNVNSIEVATFSGCSSLQIVSLGEKVTYIGNNAFDRCKMVKKFYSWNPTPPSAGSESLSGINRSECTLYVPKGSGDIYWLHPEWGQFFDIKEIETSDINAISKYDIQSSYFNLDGKRTNNTRKGINIIKMNNEAIKKVFIK